MEDILTIKVRISNVFNICTEWLQLTICFIRVIDSYYAGDKFTLLYTYISRLFQF